MSRGVQEVAFFASAAKEGVLMARGAVFRTRFALRGEGTDAVSLLAAYACLYHIIVAFGAVLALEVAALLALDDRVTVFLNLLSFVVFLVDPVVSRLTAAAAVIFVAVDAASMASDQLLFHDVVAES